MNKKIKLADYVPSNSDHNNCAGKTDFRPFMAYECFRLDIYMLPSTLSWSAPRDAIIIMCGSSLNDSGGYKGNSNKKLEMIENC